MVGGVVATPLVLYTNLEYATIVALAAIFFIASVELLAAQWGIRLPFWADQFKRTRRAEEHFSWASVGFLATLVLLAWLLPTPVALAAAGMLAFGDGMSALLGRSLGRHKIWYNPSKSWEGSAAGFVASFVGAWAILAFYAWKEVGGTWLDAYPWTALTLVCLAGSFFGMLAESLPRLQDNVTLPTFAGLSMTALWMMLDLVPRLGQLPARWSG